MPQVANYSVIISLISSVRLGSYRTTFRSANECELYGIYIWSQHAAASIYPLLQNLEISLRNAIDKEARARFGERWWERIQSTRDQGDCHFFELREYRNRISHHEPLWVKSPNVNNARAAIDTIREKINKIELVIEALDINLLNIMRKVGLFDNARRVCSLDELAIYRYTKPFCSMTPEQMHVIETHCWQAKQKNETIIWRNNNTVYGLRTIR